MQPLILASSSPFRRELLTRLRHPFIVISPDIDESPRAGELPQETALRLAQEKARKVAETQPDSIVIGCDQVAMLDDMQLGKPGNHANAVRQLRAMRGRRVAFHSALCVYNAATQDMQATVIPYHVTFRALTDEEIENYLRLEEPYNCAGSAKSEGLGIALIAEMEGSDPNALIGLPLIALIDMLKHNGIHVI
jgi:septum formation protein